MKLSKFLPMLLLLFLCSCRQPVVPNALIGTWQTSDPRYQGKFLQIDDKFIVLGLGEELVPKVERIVRIESRREGPFTSYVIDSKDQQGLREKITIQYTSRNGGELRLSNPIQVLWKKAS